VSKTIQTPFPDLSPAIQPGNHDACAGLRDANLNTASFDGDGILWFTGQAGVIGRLDPHRGVPSVQDAPRGRGPYGICTTPRGEVWWASLAGSFIARIDRRNGASIIMEPPTHGQNARRI